MNEQLAYKVIQEAITSGVTEFCICPGNRNAPLYTILMQAASVRKYFWFEERSAAFFALGRSRATGRPVAVITTSGSAAGEMLPAAMEAYYTGTPLLLITADRPKRFRGSGAPQSAEQVGLYGNYAPFTQDVAEIHECDLANWDCTIPAHLNVCFEEPFPQSKEVRSLSNAQLIAVNSISCLQRTSPINPQALVRFQEFVKRSRFPFVVVSSLKSEARKSVVNFLLQLNAPVFLEGVSGIREEPRLQHLRITRTDGLWLSAEKSGYSIDGILRIGGVPTFRMWRDIEEKEGKIAVCSISEVPFSGLSWGDVIHASISRFCKDVEITESHFSSAERWLEADREYLNKLHKLFQEEPLAEPSLIHQLSRRIPKQASIYLGNSLPIREWDLAACNEDKNFVVHASRGINGIDGQMSTFFGLSKPNNENWGILGDLTTLYDLAAPWILPQLSDIDIRVNLVVVNNSGGQIFSKFIPEKTFINSHELSFGPIAKMWGMRYEKWDRIPDKIDSDENRLIEIVPDLAATARFNKILTEL